jgi:hypothetical protein
MNVSSMPAHHARVQDVCVLLGERSLEGRSLEGSSIDERSIDERIIDERIIDERIIDERIINERIMVTGDAPWRSRGSDPMDNDPHVLFG